MNCVPVSRPLVQKNKIVPVFYMSGRKDIVNWNVGSVISLQMILTQCQRPDPEFGGDGKLFFPFLNDVFSEKIYIFTAKIEGQNL